MPPATGFADRFKNAVHEEHRAQPLKPRPALTEADLRRLPDPVRRYVRASGALGRPRPQNQRVVLGATMRLKPGQDPIRAESVQYNFFGRPARMFFMRARMFGVPLHGLHIYRREAATFEIKAARAIALVNQQGPALTTAETVTVLNDMCAMAPGTLTDERLAWSALDDRSARVVFTNGPYKVAAELHFDGADQLVDFASDDRPDTSGGRITPMRWNTPLSEHGTLDGKLDGMRLATRGAAVYAYPDGPFEYAVFTFRSLHYDIIPPWAG